MEIAHIKANGNYYRPQEAGVQNPGLIKGCCYPVCYIKKLWFGRWQIDYHSSYDVDYNKGVPFHSEHIITTRIILYPSGIEEIKYLNTK